MIAKLKFQQPLLWSSISHDLTLFWFIEALNPEKKSSNHNNNNNSKNELKINYLYILKKKYWPQTFEQ